jgi:hypothetical protein
MIIMAWHSFYKKKNIKNQIRERDERLKKRWEEYEEQKSRGEL